MRRIVVAIVLLTWIAIPGFAQKIRRVSGSYIYVIPETQSYIEAKETAILKAQLQILANTYGTTMDLSTSTSITDVGTKVHALSQSQIKGEWLETIGQPIITKLFDGDNFAIKVEITGKVREVASSSSDFIAKVLCGVPDIRYENVLFNSGDRLFLYFQAPGDGFLTVYLFDGQDTVFCLLPYTNQSRGICPIIGGTEYIFFSRNNNNGDKAMPSKDIDEYTLETSSILEVNRLYIIFSPNPFLKALDN